jgi:hypothetical protein
MLLPTVFEHNCLLVGQWHWSRKPGYLLNRNIHFLPGLVNIRVYHSQNIKHGMYEIKVHSCM